MAEGQASVYTELSWRVHLLPYLDQLPLYEKFHLDEPWDSPHNKTLMDKMPDIYRVDLAEESTTRFRVITGPETAFPKPQGATLRSFRDGASNTLVAVAVGPGKAVTWTKPEEIAFDAQSPVECLGDLGDTDSIFYIRGDGGVSVLSSSIPADMFKALVTPAGQERLPKEFADYRLR